MSRNKHHDPHNIEDKGNFSSAYHMEMVSDSERVGQLKRAVLHYADETKIFCELGCGTGIFSILAAKHYKNVISIDIDENMLAIAKHNAKAAGVADKITFIHGDARKSQGIIEDKIDVLFCEMLSTWMMTEPQIQVLNQAWDTILDAKTRVIPRRIVNLVEIGNYDYTFEDILYKAPIAQFSGVRPPRIVSSSYVAFETDLEQKNPVVQNGAIDIMPLADVEINCVRLTSIVDLAEGLMFYSTDTLMPPAIVPTENTLYAKRGEPIRLSFDVKHNASIQESKFTLQSKD